MNIYRLERNEVSREIPARSEFARGPTGNR